MKITNRKEKLLIPEYNGIIARMKILNRRRGWPQTGVRTAYLQQ